MHPTQTAVLLSIIAAALGAVLLRRVLWGAPIFGRDPDLRPYGARTGSSSSSSWAVVTGATSGIGREIALALAQGGFNVFAVGGPTDEASGLAARLRAELAATGREAHVQCVDAAAPNAADTVVDAVAATLPALPGTLRVLVNNVGVGAPTLSTFDTQTWGTIARVLQVNVVFTAALTRFLLPRLTRDAASGAGGRSALVVMASLSGLVPAPYIATYAATKAFLCSFAESLRLECEVAAAGCCGGLGKLLNAQRFVCVVWVQGRGVDVRAVAPGKVHAGATPAWYPGEAHADPRDIAAATLRSLRHPDTVVSPHWPHALQKLFLDVSPAMLLRPIMRHIQHHAYATQLTTMQSQM